MKRLFPAAVLLLAASFVQRSSAEKAPLLKLVQTVPIPASRGPVRPLCGGPARASDSSWPPWETTPGGPRPGAGKVLRQVRGMHEPQGVAYAPDLHRLFVGNGETGTCEALDGRSFMPVHREQGLDDADNVRYDAAAHQIYVGYGGGALAVLDARSGRRLGEIRLKGHPESFQLERSGPRIFVNVPQAGHVAVVDRKKRAVVAAWPLTGAGANFPMALDEEPPAPRRLPAAGRLLVFDTTSGKQVATAEIAGDTDDLWYDATRKLVYAACGEGAISVLRQRDADHYEPAARITTAPGARTAFFAPELERFYLAVPHRGASGGGPGLRSQAVTFPRRWDRGCLRARTPMSFARSTSARYSRSQRVRWSRWR